MAANAERAPPAQCTTMGVARSGTRFSTWPSRLPRGMRTAPLLWATSEFARIFSGERSSVACEMTR